ncbi:hypothetical protein [Nitrosopumilus sp. S4]
MKVEVVQSESVSELDSLINNCIQKRKVHDIKLSSVVLPDGKIIYTSVIMLEM